MGGESVVIPIHNNHNVYVMGAGFSAARGIPVISEFMVALRDAHEWLQAHGRHAEAKSIQKVLEFRLRATPAAYRVQVDLENIEELFSLASATGEQLTEDICRAIAATISFCETRTASPVSKFSTALDVEPPTIPEALLDFMDGDAGIVTYRHLSYNIVVARLLGALSDELPKAENTFLSFNYDLLLENALSALGIPFTYGLKASQFQHRIVVVSTSPRLRRCCTKASRVRELGLYTAAIREASYL
jgi:hypothetical protein